MADYTCKAGAPIFLWRDEQKKRVGNMYEGRKVSGTILGERLIIFTALGFTDVPPYCMWLTDLIPAYTEPPTVPPDYAYTPAGAIPITLPDGTQLKNKNIVEWE